MADSVTLDTRSVLELAAEADVDPRSIRHELAAIRGERPHVRGRAGERIRAAFEKRGLLRREAA